MTGGGAMGAATTLQKRKESKRPRGASLAIMTNTRGRVCGEAQWHREASPAIFIAGKLVVRHHPAQRHESTRCGPVSSIRYWRCGGAGFGNQSKRFGCNNTEKLHSRVLSIGHDSDFHLNVSIPLSVRFNVHVSRYIRTFFTGLIEFVVF
jgi:hypothetical protein